MPKLEFGSLEMTPMYNVSADNERRKEELDSPTRIITNDLHEFDVTMPEADEPTKLEEIPLTESDESTRHVKKSRIIGINKVQLTSGSAPRYMFIVKLDWDDRTVTFINRDHDDFFRYHCWVLDTFKREAGHGDDPRTIPMLPGLCFLFIAREFKTKGRSNKQLYSRHDIYIWKGFCLKQTRLVLDSTQLCITRKSLCK